MVKVGDKIPAMKLMVATAEGPREADTAELFGPGKVVMFAVPGAFTPTCSAKHFPGFAEHLAEFKAKGVDRIICMAVNDAFVLGAWAKTQEGGEGIIMLSDGSGTLHQGDWAWSSTSPPATSASAASVSRSSLRMESLPISPSKNPAGSTSAALRPCSKHFEFRPRKTRGSAPGPREGPRPSIRYNQGYGRGV